MQNVENGAKATEGETKRVPLAGSRLFLVSSKIPISLFGCLIFLGVLWLLDFPKPHIDDLSYVGAGINMAAGGDFSNPLISREFSEHYAFYYPPIHPYVLAGWLKVFGISAASLTGFQMTMYFLCAASAIFILRKNQSPVWLEWLAPLAATNAFIAFGLRPESMAAAFNMVGFAMIECGVRNRMLVFLAFLLMILGGVAAPRMVFFAAAFIIFALWRLSAPIAQDRRERWVPLGLATAAGALTVVLFSAMIHFQFEKFWKTFHQNSQVVGYHTLLESIRWHFGYTQAVVGFFAIAAFVILWRRPRDELTRISLVIAVVIPIEILTKISIYGISRWYALLICLFLVASLSKQSSAFWKMVLHIGIAFALLLLNSAMIVNIAGRISGRIQETKKQEVGPEPLQGHTVFVDCAAARYYFNYHLPPGSVDFYFCLPFSKHTPVQGIARPTDLYFVGPQNVDFLREHGGLDYQPLEKWSPPLNFSKLSFYKYSQQIFIICPASCKSIAMDAAPD